MYLQRILRELEYYAGPAHGVYDQATMQAVAAFQYASGITVNGIVGRETSSALQKYYAVMHNEI